jgi:hypothetical protein
MNLSFVLKKKQLVAGYLSGIYRSWRSMPAQSAAAEAANFS